MNLEQTLQFEVSKLDRLIKQEKERYDSEWHAGRLSALEGAKNRFEEILTSQKVIRLVDREISRYREMLRDAESDTFIARIEGTILGLEKARYFINYYA